MNYIKHLTLFFQRVAVDDRLLPSHVSLYMSLFQMWNVNRFENPISISRGEVMKISKISGTTTYHKCMRELQAYGYIQYKPSYNPLKGSRVILHSYHNDPDHSQTNKKPIQKTYSDKSRNQSTTSTGTETAPLPSPDQQTEPSINTINTINGTKLLNNTLNKENLKNDFQKPAVQKKVSSAAAAFVPPAQDEVRSFFLQKGFPPADGDKFFYYFSSNGWLIGGKTPMNDWRAAAHSWILNKKTSPSHERAPKGPNPGNLHTGKNKNYNEPL